MFDAVKRWWRDRRSGTAWRSPAEATETSAERAYAEESVEDQTAGRFAEEHLGGFDPDPPQREDY